MSHTERSRLIEFLRGELVGPIRSAGGTRPRFEVKEIGNIATHPAPDCRNAWLWWKPEGESGGEEEILSIHGGNNPYRSYGVGVLYPGGLSSTEDIREEQDQGAANGPEGGNVEAASSGNDAPEEAGDDGATGVEMDDDRHDRSVAPDNDFEIYSPDATRPSTIAISFCAKVEAGGSLLVSLPRARKMWWQTEDQSPFPLNGFYENFKLDVGKSDGNGSSRWTATRRRPAVAPKVEIRFSGEDLVGSIGKATSRQVELAQGMPTLFQLDVAAYPRRQEDGSLLVTVVLRNNSRSTSDAWSLALFQTCFTVQVEGGTLCPYPDSERPAGARDADEQTMELLYRNTQCWAIGHGCAAEWTDEEDGVPKTLVADVLPAVELPSMTPDIELDGRALTISMSDLADLPDPESDSGAWGALELLARGYGDWLRHRRREVETLPEKLKDRAEKHLAVCDQALERIRYGIGLLRKDADVRAAFRWANEAMLLQQVSLKQIERRDLVWSGKEGKPVPDGIHADPFQLRQQGAVRGDLGKWRAFQIAFLLMSLRGMVEPDSDDDRELVDLVWFPTGGGKTEAYLGVAAFQMFHQRLLMAKDQADTPKRDGVNVLMRYTLRMLTTDQFQRAASLICGMEAIRKRENEQRKGITVIAGGGFRLGLWLGSGGTPNKVEDATRKIGEFAEGKKGNSGNPLVLTDCPWCRSAIGRLESKPKDVKKKEEWEQKRLAGILKSDSTMHCPDKDCCFKESLPVEVIDERIYEKRPSLVIGTADKFAMLAYTREAGKLFGRTFDNGEVIQSHVPPSLIIQDELHLISGPLGTLFGLYETMIGDLCTWKRGNRWELPKIISSTATVRGADQQVLALFAREKTSLFPPPGLDISDSFFGRYARTVDGSLANGRLYVGIQALYGSLQTTQARAFSAVLARAVTFEDDRKKKDPWWTLLAYYNSIRELSGARTLFDSDIGSRLGHLKEREGIDRRYIHLEELSSRLSQAQIVEVKGKLAEPFDSTRPERRVDACLSSNIIEVGVDIDRLSLMAVVGQPKSTASYIQASGRVGRRWWERPGLILTILNPYKSRDASHFEQFHTYHRRLYERVEPTSATPFSLAALERGLVGALLAHVRQQVNCREPTFARFSSELEKTMQLFRERCEQVTGDAGDLGRSMEKLEKIFDRLKRVWGRTGYGDWFDWNQPEGSSLLMLVPGKYATKTQHNDGFPVPTSLRTVDAQAELELDWFPEDMT